MRSLACRLTQSSGATWTTGHVVDPSRVERHSRPSMLPRPTEESDMKTRACRSTNDGEATRVRRHVAPPTIVRRHAPCIFETGARTRGPKRQVAPCPSRARRMRRAEERCRVRPLRALGPGLRPCARVLCGPRLREGMAPESLARERERDVHRAAAGSKVARSLTRWRTRRRRGHLPRARSSPDGVMVVAPSQGHSLAHVRPSLPRSAMRGALTFVTASAQNRS